MLLFLLCCKASQISKMQKRIRLLCPNRTRKTLNNVAHIFLVILNGTQKNGHNRPCHRARSHYLPLWMFAAPMAAFARFCVISLNIFSLFSSCPLMFVSISTRSKNILTPYSFLRLNERRASQATRTSSSLWKNLLHNSGDRSCTPTMRRRASPLVHMFAPVLRNTWQSSGTISPSRFTVPPSLHIR